MKCLVVSFFLTCFSFNMFKWLFAGPLLVTDCLQLRCEVGAEVKVGGFDPKLYVDSKHLSLPQDTQGAPHPSLHPPSRVCDPAAPQLPGAHDVLPSCRLAPARPQGCGAGPGQPPLGVCWALGPPPPQRCPQHIPCCAGLGFSHRSLHTQVLAQILSAPAGGS